MYWPTVFAPRNTVPLRVTAADEAGLARVSISIRRAGDEQAREANLTLPPRARALERDHTLDLATLNLRPGDRFEVTVYAQDSEGEVSSTPPRWMAIPLCCS